MEYQKIINLLDKGPNQPSKFRTKNWLEINVHARGKYSTKSQNKFKATILKSGLCNYSNAYIFVTGTINAVEREADAAARVADINNKQAMFKNFAKFTECISEINNTKVNNENDLML